MTWLGLVPGLLHSTSSELTMRPTWKGNEGGGGGGGCEENPDKKCAKQLSQPLLTTFQSQMAALYIHWKFDKIHLTCPSYPHIGKVINFALRVN